MFTRSKLRKILYRHRQELEKDYFRKLKLPKDNDNIIIHQFGNYIGMPFIDGHNENNKQKEEQQNKKTSNEMKCVRRNFPNVTVAELDQNNIDYSKLDTFHRAIWPIMVLAQCFSLMPVVGVYHPNPQHLRFTLKSLPMFVTFVFLIAGGLITSTMLKHLTIIGVNAKNFVGAVFFLCVLSTCILFISLAKRWPDLVRHWTRIELTFTRTPYEDLKKNLKKRVRLSAFFLIFCSLAEHALYMTSAVSSYTRRIKICAQANNASGDVYFDEFIRMNYDYVFRILPSNKFVGIYILIINGACTFVWNYMDLFIMMISKGIAYRFEQITVRINKIAEKDATEAIFIEIREDYVKVCELLDIVDEHLSGIILLSCMNNLYFVCYQLLNIFNKLRWPINYIYFWYSLLFLIGRTAFVFLSAATINDESKAALGVLRSVSNKNWCVEVERLIFQMTTQTVALSGKKFYFLTRRLLFGMAGTIVTYELVLLQFDEPNRTQGLPPLCS